MPYDDSGDGFGVREKRTKRKPKLRYSKRVKGECRTGGARR